MANLKKNKKYHYTYKTINKTTGRYYYGMHSTNNLKDNYIGSGKRLWYEIRKYGKENFKFGILEFYNSREELIKAEIGLITEEDLKNPNCLNCKPGGTGGFLPEHQKLGAALGAKAHNDRAKIDKEFREYRIEKIRQKLQSLYRDKKLVGTRGFLGKTHKEETKQKMSALKKGSGTGSRNSQFGTSWITNEVENKKISKNTPIPKGWRLGRKLK